MQKKRAEAGGEFHFFPKMPESGDGRSSGSSESWGEAVKTELAQRDKDSNRTMKSYDEPQINLAQTDTCERSENTRFTTKPKINSAEYEAVFNL